MLAEWPETSVLPVTHQRRHLLKGLGFSRAATAFSRAGLQPLRGISP
jgi:hypothetical protein